MGSSGSRPRLQKVAPCKSLEEEGEQLKPQWTLPALPVTLEQSPRSLKHRKTILPPLKQEITLSTLSEPYFTGSLSRNQSNYSSIIHSHPPRRPQALQPLTHQIGHTSSASQIVMSRGCRDGGVLQFSTPDQTGHTGTGKMIQGKFLEAQTALTQQAHQQRRAHLRQSREMRRHKVVYTVNVGNQNTEGRKKLVRRPTERDIFWDETTADSLDPSCLMGPTSPPFLSENRQSNQLNSQVLCTEVDMVQHNGDQSSQTVKQFGQRRWVLDKNLPWTIDRETVRVEQKGKAQDDGRLWPESA